MDRSKVSEKTIRRLSHYSMCLRRATNAGIQIITSSYLAQRCGISPAAVRKDLASYGDFGKQGSGYNVRELLASIEEILGTNRPPAVVVVGVGNIGRALLASGLEGTGGYEYSAAFDTDPELIGRTFSGVGVHPLSDIERVAGELGNFIAVVAVPEGRGQAAVDSVTKAGCRAVLSFTLEPIEVPENVMLRYVEVSTELDILTHHMRRAEQQ
ncbi:MAG: redox-sensing transcriptional repressor Rex [Candidatus Aegiribacteria sp.]